MTAWLAFGAPLLAGVSVIALLGLPAAFALRLRGFVIPVVAVPAAFAVISVSMIIAPIVGVGWSLLPALAFALILAAILFVLRRWIAAPAQRGVAARDLWAGVGAAAIGGAIIALCLVLAMRSPEAISQRFDVGFHLNAVRYMLDTGSASPFTMDLTSPGTPVFYPTLWHAFVTLIAQLSGATIPAATNAALFIVASIVWPIGAVALGRAVAGPSLRITLISGSLAAAFPIFPLFLASYGVIYPNLMALAIMSFVLVAGLQLLNLGPARRALEMSTVARWLFFLGALGAASLAHPSIVHSALVWGALPMLFAAYRAWRGRPVPGADGLFVQPSRGIGLRRASAVTGVTILILVAAGAWTVGRTTDNPWGGFHGPRAAFIEFIGGVPHLSGHAWALSVLILVGALLAWKHRTMRWLLGAAAALALFYYISDGFPASEWRTLFLSPWYNDPRRLAALVPFGALPLAVLGASAAWSMLRPGIARFTNAFAATPARARRFISVLALLALIGAGQAGNSSTLDVLEESYKTQDADLISEDERELIERIDEEVPDGEVIVNHALDGSPLIYALSGHQVLFPHSGGMYDALYYELIDSFVDDPARACEIAGELDVRFVTDFGDHYVFELNNPRGAPFKNMKELERSSILQEVDHEGDATLFEIVGC